MDILADILGIGTGPSTLALPLWLDVASVVVGAISGALVAAERRLDLVGSISLSLLCGLGGGLLRDMIMQKGSVYMLENPFVITACVIVGIVVFYFARAVAHFPKFVDFIDIIAVGLFAVSGTDKAIVYELGSVACILMGALTGTGGGMLRDVFLGEVPAIFRQSNLYAVCGVVGSLVYLLLVRYAGASRLVAALIGVIATLILRVWSVHFGIKSPQGRDLTGAVLNRARSMRDRYRD